MKKQKVKKSKNWHFSKGGYSMVLVKNLKIFHLFNIGKISQQNVFDDILERKKCFETLKSESQKSWRIRIFPKGLVYGVGQKLENFPCFYFCQNQTGKRVWRYSRKEKKAFLDSKIRKLKKSKNQDFSKGDSEWF